MSWKTPENSRAGPWRRLKSPQTGHDGVTAHTFCQKRRLCFWLEHHRLSFVNSSAYVESDQIQGAARRRWQVCNRGVEIQRTVRGCDVAGRAVGIETRRSEGARGARAGRL